MKDEINYLIVMCCSIILPLNQHLHLCLVYPKIGEISEDLLFIFASWNFVTYSWARWSGFTFNTKLMWNAETLQTDYSFQFKESVCSVNLMADRIPTQDSYFVSFVTLESSLALW